MVDTAGRIGNHRLERTLGTGAFATVWLAHDELLDAPVAIKVLADNWARQHHVRERFIAEARILRRLDHDRIVRVHVVDELPDGRPYLVMALADRGTLGELALERVRAGRPLTLAEVVDVVDELCECLRVVHGLGVVHRDVKPSNVLLRSARRYDGAGSQAFPDVRMVLGDFGLAKDLVVASGFTLGAGTPAYMAPEQASPTTELDHRADVFAAAAIAVELLAGRPLGPEDRRGDDTPPAVAALEGLRDVPAPVAAVLRRALDTERDRRPPDAAAFASALAGAAAGAPRAAPRGTVAERVAEMVRRAEALPGAGDLGGVARRLAGPARVGVLRQPGARPAGAVVPEGLEVVDLAPGAAPVGAGGLDAVVVALAPGVAPTDADGAAALTAARVAAAEGGAVLLAPLAATDDPEHLRQVLAGLGARAALLRASAALEQLLARLEATPSPATASILDALDRPLDELRRSVPALAELPLLRQAVAGTGPLPDDLADEAARLLLPLDPPVRLGLPPGADDDDRRREAAAALERWRALRGADRVPVAARAATDAVIACLERLWSIP